jgi:hypothetical protein
MPLSSRLRSERCRTRTPASLPVSIEPCPTVEACRRDVDRTRLRENLKLTTAERAGKMMAALRFADAVRRSRPRA